MDWLEGPRQPRNQGPGDASRCPGCAVKSTASSKCQDLLLLPPLSFPLSFCPQISLPLGKGIWSCATFPRGLGGVWGAPSPPTFSSVDRARTWVTLTCPLALGLGGLEEGSQARFSHPGQEVAELIGKHRAMMKHVLEDARLVALRLEGGTVLARLRREEHGAGQDYQ